MTYYDIKLKLSNDTKTVTFYIPSRKLMIDTEKILLANGWQWRAMNNSIPLINMRSEFNGITSMLLYSNFNNNGNKDVKRLSFSSHTTDHSEDVISISEDVLKLMEMIFKPVPNYNPRKIVKEI